MTFTRLALYDACRTLFGDGISVGPEFLAYLQPSGARSAFRNRAKEHHPDRFAGASPEVRAAQTARFREIRQAYTLLSDFLASRRIAPPKPEQPRHRSRSRRSAGEPGRALPPLRLEFGLFAFYQGKIEYRDLIDALVWQRRQRPQIGTLACRWGWLDEPAVRRVLGHGKSKGRFGRKAVELGVLNPRQVTALLLHQRTRQQRLGQYFVDHGLMTAAEADRLARDLARHNARFTPANGR